MTAWGYESIDCLCDPYSLQHLAFASIIMPFLSPHPEFSTQNIKKSTIGSST